MNRSTDTKEHDGHGSKTKICMTILSVDCDATSLLGYMDQRCGVPTWPHVPSRREAQ
jgi:hypothetical protein